MDCRTFVESLDDYLGERLEGAERRAFREHLAGCAPCRSRAVDADPSLLLIPTHKPEVDARAVEACCEGVSLLIHQERLRKRLAGPRRRWLAAAAAVLVAVSAGVMWRLAPAPFEATAVGVNAQVEEEAGQAGPPEVEVEMQGESLRVYQYADAGDENTAVYFVVNEGLEL